MRGGESEIMSLKNHTWKFTNFLRQWVWENLKVHIGVKLIESERVSSIIKTSGILIDYNMILFAKLLV